MGIAGWGGTNIVSLKNLKAPSEKNQEMSGLVTVGAMQSAHPGLSIYTESGIIEELLDFGEVVWWSTASTKCTPGFLTS